MWFSDAVDNAIETFKRKTISRGKYTSLKIPPRHISKPQLGMCPILTLDGSDFWILCGLSGF